MLTAWLTWYSCGDGYAAVDVIITAVVTGDRAGKIDVYVKLSVVVTGCVLMSVDGGVGMPIHGLKD